MVKFLEIKHGRIEKKRKGPFSCTVVEPKLSGSTNRNTFQGNKSLPKKMYFMPPNVVFLTKTEDKLNIFL